MRVIIEIRDELIVEWGTVIICPVQLKVEDSQVLLPGFKYRLPASDKERPTFFVTTEATPAPVPVVEKAIAAPNGATIIDAGDRFADKKVIAAEGVPEVPPQTPAQ
jgi:hypothetical protein